MKQFIDMPNCRLQLLTVLFSSACTFVLIQIFSLPQIIGFIAVLFFLIVAVLNVRNFIFVLFAVKPVIDLMWNVSFVNVGGKSLNPLGIIALFVFIVIGYQYFVYHDRRKIYNEKTIWIFLGVHIFSSIVAVMFFNCALMQSVEFLLKLMDAYMIYFIFHKYIEDDESKLKIYKIVWISAFIVTIISIIVYSTGKYNINISQGVDRFAGLYNDAGTPSYMAIISLLFGTLYFELCKKSKSLTKKVKVLFIGTIFTVGFILVITVTRSAMVMLFIFLIMWIGFFKRKLYLILPVIIFGSIFIYMSSEGVQMRMEREMSFVQRGEFTLEDAEGIGSGRVALWRRAMKHYTEDFDLLQKFIGTYNNFGAHNQYIAYLLQVGILGLFAFLAIVFRFYLKLISLYKNSKNPDIFMGIILLTIFTINGITGHPFDYTTLLWYLMILLSLINTSNNKLCHEPNIKL